MSAILFYNHKELIMKKIINITLIATVSLLFTACTSSTPVMVKSPSYKVGEKDGCTTATGDYTKNGDAFDIDKDYKNGWYAGRKNCNPAQAQN